MTNINEIREKVNEAILRFENAFQSYIMSSEDGAKMQMEVANDTLKECLETKSKSEAVDSKSIEKKVVKKNVATLDDEDSLIDNEMVNEVHQKLSNLKDIMSNKS